MVSCCKHHRIHRNVFGGGRFGRVFGTLFFGEVVSSDMVLSLSLVGEMDKEEEDDKIDES